MVMVYYWQNKNLEEIELGSNLVSVWPWTKTFCRSFLSIKWDTTVHLTGLPRELRVYKAPKNLS